MKTSKLFVLMGLIVLVLSLTVGNAEETIKPTPAPPGTSTVLKYVIPAGTPFVVLHRMMGPITVVSPDDNTITAIKVLKANDGVTEVVEFSLSYDQPTIRCPQHGVDIYDLYKNALGSDSGLVRKDLLKEVE